MMEFLEEHLKAGRIRPSSSHIASGTWMIPKEDPNVMPRVVHDYRAVNGNTVKDHTPLTRQDDIIEKLANAVVRGKIDLICAYYQILMEEADIHKTAFKTPFGLYEWLVMPQGLCNAVATFQRYMNWILKLLRHHQNVWGEECKDAKPMSHLVAKSSHHTAKPSHHIAKSMSHLVAKSSHRTAKPSHHIAKLMSHLTATSSNCYMAHLRISYIKKH
jgi:hypothetical protein